MGLAADQGTHASQEPSLPSMSEEDDEQTLKEANGHAAPMPDIQVVHAEEVQTDPLEDIDRSIGMSLWDSQLLALTLFESQSTVSGLCTHMTVSGPRSYVGHLLCLWPVTYRLGSVR
jgi:hypothetical protein